MKRRVKTVGFCFHDFSQGGIQRVMSLLLPRLSASGIELVLLTTKDSQGDVYHVEIDCPRLVLGDFDRTGIRARNLRCAIMDNRIDLLVFEEYYSKALPSDVEVANSLGIPYIIHHHNVFSNFFLRDASINELQHYKCFADAAALIVLSRADEYYFRTLGCNAHYIPNPVVDVPDSFVRQPKPKMLVWMGRYTEIKRPLDALKIFEKVLASHPDASLYMLGDFPINNICDKVRQYVKTSPQLKNAVHFEGYQNDIWQYLSNATALITTSKFEGFPCSMSEAAAASVPVVGYELPYLEFANGNDGFIQSPQADILAAAENIKILLSNMDMQKEVAASCRKWFDNVRTFDQASAYRRIINDVEDGLRVKVPSGLERMVLKTTIVHGFTGLITLKKRIQEIKQKNIQLSDKVANLTTQLSRVCELEKKCDNLNKKVAEYKREILNLHNSFSYRVGMFVTWPARKIWRAVNEVRSRMRHSGKRQKTERK